MTDLEHPQQRWGDWVREACAVVGADPALVDIVEIHHLSKEVAHRLERPLAPVSTFILGLALGAAQGRASADGGAENGPSSERMLERILGTLPPTVEDGRGPS